MCVCMMVILSLWCSCGSISLALKYSWLWNCKENTLDMLSQENSNEEEREKDRKDWQKKKWPNCLGTPMATHI